MQNGGRHLPREIAAGVLAEEGVRGVSETAEHR